MISTLGEVVEAWLRLETVADRHLAILAVIEEERAERDQEQAEAAKVAQLERAVQTAKSELIRYHQDKSTREEFALIVERLHPWNREAFHAYIQYQGEDYARDFEEAYRGEWDSLTDYAQNFADDIGMIPKLDEVAERYVRFDAEKFGDELAEDDVFTVAAASGGVFVFDRY